MKTAQEIRQITGGYLSATPLFEVPGARQAFADLLARVQALTFVPAGWTADVQAAMSDADGNAMWQPAPAIVTGAWAAGKTEPLYPDIPGWLTQDQAAVAWNTLCDWWRERMQPILNGWARNEASLLEAANADAAFWNRLYAFVKPVAMVGDAIIAAPEAVGNVVSRSVLGALRGFAPVLIIPAVVGGGYLLHKTGALERLAGKIGK